MFDQELLVRVQELMLLRVDVGDLRRLELLGFVNMRLLKRGQMKQCNLPLPSLPPRRCQFLVVQSSFWPKCFPSFTHHFFQRWLFDLRKTKTLQQMQLEWFSQVFIVAFWMQTFVRLLNTHLGFDGKSQEPEASSSISHFFLHVLPHALNIFTLTLVATM